MIIPDSFRFSGNGNPGPRVVIAFVLLTWLSASARPAAADFPRAPALAAVGDGSLFAGCQMVAGSDSEFELFQIMFSGATAPLGRYNGRLAGVAVSPDNRLFALTRDGALSSYGDEPALLANPDDRWNMLALGWYDGGPVAVDHDGVQLRLVRPAEPPAWGEARVIANDADAAKAALATVAGELHIVWSARSRDLSSGALRHAVLREGRWQELQPLPVGDVFAFAAFPRANGLAVVAAAPPLSGDGPVALVSRLWRDDRWSDAYAVPEPIARHLAESGGFAAARDAFLAVVPDGLRLFRTSPGADAAGIAVKTVSDADGDWSALTGIGLILAFAALLLIYCRRSRMLSLALPGRPPDLTSRAVALGVDWLLVSLAMTAYHLAAGDLRVYAELMTIGAVNEIFWITLGALALFCAIGEGVFGRTPGKYLAGLRVRSALGGPPAPLQVLFRNALRGIDMFPVVFPGLLGAIVAMFNPGRQRLGDMLAATVVRRHAPLRRRKFLLASASPRRRELLEALGLNLRVKAMEIDEDAIRGETPEATARLVAEAKARAALEHIDAAAEVVVAADTMVVLDGETLGKPRDAQEAVDMLGKLSGRSHRVLTGVMIWDTATGQGLSDVEETEVEFRQLSPREIYDYVASGEPFDKAGAYGIQSGFLVKQVRGSLSNVAGMPMELFQGMLAHLDS